jgi:hypothetical protein
MRAIPNQRSRQKKPSNSASNKAGDVVSPREFVQGLEARTLFSAAANIIVSPNIALESASSSATVSTSTGYTPTQIRDAYGFSSVDFSSGSSTVAGLGQGQTIAIVDAYNDPEISSDLGVFDAKYGLASPPSLKIVNQSGGSSLPAANAGWDGEISLDVEWAHAIAPDANILLVEASSDSLNNLLAGVNYARNAAGVSVVSMSWGGSEFYGETSYDSYFTTPAGHQGVTFVAASGDSGVFSGPEWPAVSPNVLGVGGTSLTLANSSGTYGSETAWADSTGGTSQLEPMPSYQSVIPTADTESVSFSWFGGYSVTSNRSAPDVSYDANPATGFAVYDSVPDEGYVGWQEVGGTSAGAPQWGALIAIADQGRVLKGLGSLNGASQTLTTLYSLYSAPGTAGYSSYSSTFHDVTGGGTRFDSASAGYDQLTGLGSPQAVPIISALTSSGTVTSAAKTTTSKATTTAKAAVQRQDLLQQAVPTMLLQAPTLATSYVASSPLQTWAALEDQFALADTAPSTLVPASVSVLDGNSSSIGASIGLSRFSLLGSTAASAPSEFVGAADSIAQWPASPLQTLIQSSVGLVEASVAASLPESITHILTGDAATNLGLIFSNAPVASVIAPLAGVPEKVLGLPPAIFERHIQSGASRAWETVAIVGAGVSLAGCWYLNAARREEKDVTAALRPRRVRDGWDLSPLEER